MVKTIAGRVTAPVVSDDVLVAIELICEAFPAVRGKRRRILNAVKKAFPGEDVLARDTEAWLSHIEGACRNAATVNFTRKICG